MRINKYLSQAGVCSRREADKLIAAGKVLIDKKVAKLGDEVEVDNEVEVNGKRVSSKSVNESRVILLYNKPPGLICSSSKKDGETVFDHIDYPKRLFYAGRLDKYSRGLMILTNDGELADKLMHARNAHEREYEVSLDTKVTDDALEKLSKGIYLKDINKKTKPCRVERIGDKMFSITLTQGLNRQIRRMCDCMGLRIKDLNRVRIGNLKLGKLKEGTYRKIRPEEKRELERLLDAR